jgi:hypothetical protein
MAASGCPWPRSDYRGKTAPNFEVAAFGGVTKSVISPSITASTGHGCIVVSSRHDDRCLSTAFRDRVQYMQRAQNICHGSKLVIDPGLVAWAMLGPW